MDRPPPPHGYHPNQFPPTRRSQNRTWLILALTAAILLAATSTACSRPRVRQTVTDSESVTAEYAAGDCIRAAFGEPAEEIDCEDAVFGEDYRIAEEVSDGQECADAGRETLTITATDQIFCVELV